ncbi:MAG: S8 family serine peptidase [Planctomycetota bacterium]
MNASMHTRSTILRLSAVAMTICVTLITSASRAQEIKFSKHESPKARVLREEMIRERLNRGEERVQVLINLAQGDATQAVPDLNQLDHKAARKEMVKAKTERVVLRMSGEHVRVRRSLEMQATIWAEVTATGLAALQADPDVQSIEPVETMKLHDVQGATLMNALATRPQFGGVGVSIAIVDSGVDYRHSQLGGGGFPNAKVIGGTDTADNDNDPLPAAEAHGTSCAGIAAGDVATMGDYNGGIAPDSKIYAVKVEGADGVITDAALVAAWDWCVAHQQDDPNNPIMIISMSIGGGQEFSACDNQMPAFAQAARNATAAGITLFVSSGNNGFTDSIAGPSCLSDVISVGAVYDANVGYHGYQNCTDNSTETDQVTCYSNTAAILTLLAPSHDAFTTDIVGAGGYSSNDFSADFGGTSAACPYAAGAGAALQSAAKQQLGRFLTPAEVRQLLVSTGTAVADAKAGITKPRINLGQAIASLGNTPTPNPDPNPVPAPTPTPTPTPVGLDDEAEPNDTMEQAVFLNPGSYELQGLNNDYFSIETGRGMLTVTIQGPQGDLDLGVNFAAENARNAMTSEREDSNETVIVEVSEGEHVILVAPYQGRTSGYVLSIDFTPSITDLPACDGSMCGTCSPLAAMGMIMGLCGLGMGTQGRRRVRR